jgi:hypothetical protein
MRADVAVPIGAEPSNSDGPLLNEAVVQPETVTDSLVCKWVEMHLPRFFDRLEHTCTAGDREVICALLECARVSGFDASPRDRVEFLHAALFNDCRAYGLPPHRELKTALCDMLSATPQTVDTRLCRLRRRWTALCRETFPLWPRSPVLARSGCKVTVRATLSCVGDD